MAKRKNKLFYFTLIFVVLAFVGFYLILNEINDLQNDIKNLELALEIYKKEGNIISPEEDLFGSQATSTEANGGALPPEEKKISVIPTAIIFETLSSPLLEPRTKITVTVESISKTEDGTLNVDIRAFTSEATTYSALEPRNFFELINLEENGKTEKPIDIKGTFQSIPPKSAISGRVIFKVEPAKNIIILQISYDETIKYYELNFSKKTYKETILG